MQHQSITERLAMARGFTIQCLTDEAHAINDLVGQLDENFDHAVEMIFHCKGKVIVTGVGKSGNIGAKIAATLSSTGTPAFFINPLDRRTAQVYTHRPSQPYPYHCNDR